MDQRPTGADTPAWWARQGGAFLACLLAAAGSLAAQGVAEPSPERGFIELSAPRVLSPRSAADCLPGLATDDGSFETGVVLGGEAAIDVVTRFELPQTPVLLNRLCVCWTRTSGGDDVVDFDLLLYDDGGPGATPGDLVTGFGGLQAVGVPLFPAVAFYSIDVAALGLELGDERLYIGPSWNTTVDGDVELCGDTSGTIVRPTYASTDLGASWTDLGGFFPDLRAVGVRAVVGEPAPTVCVPDETTFCLNGGRFEATVAWKKPNGEEGVGRRVPVDSEDSALFWFFRADNWELLVKVLDACSFDGHFWVFSAAVTNVEYTLTITDTATGAVRTYVNPQGVNAAAVNDTRAFDTCP